MGFAEVMTGLKNKVLDAATYELLRRNFELLEENNQQLKDRVEFLKEEAEKLKKANLLLTERNAGLQAEVDMAKKAEEFVESQGFAFKKNADGTVDYQAYCPDCKKRMNTVDRSIYICPSCDYTTNPPYGPSTIADELNKQVKAKPQPAGA